MDADLRKIKKLTKMMKKEGLLVLKTPEIELQLSPEAVFHEEPKGMADSSPASTEIKEENKYTQEEALFWSSPGQFSTDEVTV